MTCFSLELMDFHRVAFAHSLSMENYRFSFSTAGFGPYGPAQGAASGLLEVGYVVKNPLVVENRTLGETYTVEEGDVFLFPPGHDVTVYAKYPGEHKHITSEFMVDSRVEAGLAADAAPHPGSERRLVLPYRLSAQQVRSAVRHGIHRFAADYSLLVEKSYFAQCGEFYGLLEGLRRSADPEEAARSYISPLYKAHCKQAEAYIEEHIRESITPGDVAAAVGLSKNYLINIFSRYKGMGLTEYVNRVKLNRIRLLVLRYGYTMKQACEEVGYTDPNYISRLFRKYYGVSFKEYCYSLKLPEGEPM